jgi:hypothetical protein
MPTIDKQGHFWWGWAMAATLYPVNLWLGIFVSAVLGACKELWDAQGHGTPDKMDFAATALGGAVGAFFCVILGMFSG